MKKYKDKLLKVLNILIKKSDEKHPLSAGDIIDELAKENINAERKSIYDDIKILKNNGIEIITTKKPKAGYYVEDYTYSLTEIKLLTDIIAYSNFISESQSNRLIQKLLKNVSEYNENIINRQLYYPKNKNRINDGFYGIETILEAIDQNRIIEFRYFDLDDKKNRIFRNKNYRYLPKALTYDDNKYYLIAYSFKHDSLVHFRVDKMASIELKEVSDVVSDDISAYIDENFSMYSGSKQNVTLEVRKNNDEYYYVNFDIRTSIVFLGFLFTVSDSVNVVKPKELTDDLCRYSANILKKYGRNV